MYIIEIYSGDEYDNLKSKIEYKQLSNAREKVKKIISVAIKNEITCIKIINENRIIVWSWYHDIDDEEYENESDDNNEYDEDTTELIYKYKLYQLKPSFINVQQIYDEYRYEGYGEGISIECEKRLMNELKKWAIENKNRILELINLNIQNSKWDVLKYFDNKFKNIESEYNKCMENYLIDYNIERGEKSNNEIMNELI